MTSQKRNHDKLSEDELAEREEVAAEYFSNSVKIRTAERRLKELRTKQKALLANHPFLSNSVGALHKGSFNTPPAGVKKQKRDEDQKMEEAPGLVVTGSSKTRLAKLVAQKRHLEQADAKQQHADAVKGSSHNK